MICAIKIICSNTYWVSISVLVRFATVFLTAARKRAWFRGFSSEIRYCSFV